MLILLKRKKNHELCFIKFVIIQLHKVCVIIKECGLEIYLFMKRE